MGIKHLRDGTEIQAVAGTDMSTAEPFMPRRLKAVVKL
tara:strand:+ start:816 stop:929 length:114 start_codon:yes stop_codon:yes gene_type:complete